MQIENQTTFKLSRHICDTFAFKSNKGTYHKIISLSSVKPEYKKVIKQKLLSPCLTLWYSEPELRASNPNPGVSCFSSGKSESCAGGAQIVGTNSTADQERNVDQPIVRTVSSQSDCRTPISKTARSLSRCAKGREVETGRKSDWVWTSHNFSRRGRK